MQTKPVRILDTTLRDGEQTPGVAFNAEAKIQIALALDRMGIHDIDAGFAAVSEEERKTLKRLTELNLRANLMSLSRTLPSDIDAVVDCGIKFAGIFIALSDLHLEKKLHLTEDQAYDKVATCLKHARSKGIKFRFSAEDGSRAPVDRLERFYAMALDLGADSLGYADTCGIDTPEKIGATVKRIREKFPSTMFSIHCHNDLGLAVANSLSAMKNGAGQIHVCVNGLGERAGNTALEDFVMAAKIGYGIDFGLKTEYMQETSALVYQLARLERPFNKPVVGKFVFSHESGIHAHGILSDARTYEPFPPALVGRSHEILLGKHSGMKNLEIWMEKYFAKVSLDESQKNALLARIKARSEVVGLIDEKELGEILTSLGYFR